MSFCLYTKEEECSFPIALTLLESDNRLGSYNFQSWWSFVRECCQAYTIRCQTFAMRKPPYRKCSALVDDLPYEGRRRHTKSPVPIGFSALSSADIFCIRHLIDPKICVQQDQACLHGHIKSQLDRPAGVGAMSIFVGRFESLLTAFCCTTSVTLHVATLVAVAFRREVSCPCAMIDARVMACQRSRFESML